MARLPRLYAPDVPQLVQARFARPFASAHEPTPTATLNLVQTWLAAETQRRNLALHGWAVVLDRVVLLATPGQAHEISRVIQGLGRRMAAGMVHGRVFTERYRSTLLEDSWVPVCLAWTESLPVRQGLVDMPARWPWSSAQEHVGLRMDTSLLTDHPSYWGMGNTPFARQAHYQRQLQSGISSAQALRIEQSLHGQWALGSDDFVTRLTQHSSRRAAPAPRGRPRKPRPGVADLPAVDNLVTN